MDELRGPAAQARPHDPGVTPAFRGVITDLTEAEAVADLARAAELTGPTDPTPWDWLALAQLGRGDTAAYRQTCRRMLALFGRTPPLLWAGGGT